MSYKQQLIELLGKINNTNNYSISDPRNGGDSFSFNIPLHPLIEDEFIKKLQPFLYKHYSYFSGNNGVINNLKQSENKNDSRLWFPEIHQQIIQRDAFWEIDSVESNGWVVARKNSERARIPAKSYFEVADLELSDKKSSFIHIITSRDIKISDTDDDKVSFFQVYGSKILKDDATNDTIRFYFNLKPDKNVIKDWKYVLMNELNARQIPFNLKYLSDLKFYDRCDAGVLYVQKQNFNLVLPIIINVYLKLSYNQEPFNDATPLFTKTIIRGVGFAESPNVRNMSFGTNICTILAKGVYNYIITHDSFEPNKCAAFIIQTYFVNNFEQPFLNPDDSYIYDFSDINCQDDSVKLSEYLNKNKYYKKFITDKQNKYLDAAIYFVNILKEKQIPITKDKNSWISVLPQEENSSSVKFGLISETERSWVQYVIDQIEKYPNPVIKPESIDELKIVDFTKKWADKFLDKISEYQLHSTINSEEETTTSNSLLFALKSIQKIYNNIFFIETTGKLKREKVKDLFSDANNILDCFIEINFPYYNKYHNWEFCPTITNGLAQIAYFFLYVHNVKQYYKIDLTRTPTLE